ncbi:MAG: hypothetical protein AAB804_02900 [Patescibacteria group bacterium]
MPDPRLPEPSNEFLSSARKGTYSKVQEIHIKNFKTRFQAARTLGALEVVRRDIMQSDLQSNVSAVGELKAVANQRAIDIGFKSSEGDSWWN